MAAHTAHTSTVLQAAVRRAQRHVVGAGRRVAALPNGRVVGLAGLYCNTAQPSLFAPQLQHTSVYCDTNSSPVSSCHNTLHGVLQHSSNKPVAPIAIHLDMLQYNNSTYQASCNTISAHTLCHNTIPVLQHNPQPTCTPSCNTLLWLAIQFLASQYNWAVTQISYATFFFFHFFFHYIFFSHFFGYWKMSQKLYSCKKKKKFHSLVHPK